MKDGTKYWTSRCLPRPAANPQALICRSHVGLYFPTAFAMGLAALQVSLVSAAQGLRRMVGDGDQHCIALYSDHRCSVCRERRCSFTTLSYETVETMTDQSLRR